MTSSSNFGLYLTGFIILIIGLALGAHLAGAPTMWIVVGVICLIGIGILSAVKKTQVPRGPNTTGPTNPPGNPPRY
jgi:urea transporter